jgi:hypothetical protein
LLIDATINGFAILARARPSLANKMVNAILNFNPFKQARAGMPLPDKIRAQSTERTATAFLNNYNRRSVLYVADPYVILNIAQESERASCWPHCCTSATLEAAPYRDFR